MSARRKAALSYSRRFGWSVFPTGGEDGKKPLTKHGVKDASTDSATIGRWWPQDHSAAHPNIGIACGSASGFWVLDVDGDDGAETLERLQTEHGALPATPRQITPSGGSHYLFGLPDKPIGNRVRFAPGLDIRGAGGYIVAPPSLSPERDAEWRWHPDYHPLETPLALAPAWLVDLVTKRPDATGNGGFAFPLSVPEGERNSTIASVTGHLLRRWVDAVLTLHLIESFNQTCCHPPLPAHEVARTVESILAKELARREAAGRG